MERQPQAGGYPENGWMKALRAIPSNEYMLPYSGMMSLRGAGSLFQGAGDWLGSRNGGPLRAAEEPEDREDIHHDEQDHAEEEQELAVALPAIRGCIAIPIT